MIYMLYTAKSSNHPSTYEQQGISFQTALYSSHCDYDSGGVGESGYCCTAHLTCYQEPITRRSVRLRMEELVL